MGIDIRIFKVSLFQSFLPCLCIKFLRCSSSLYILLGFQFIKGIMPHTGQLNSNIAGLGRPCPSGLVLICSNAMCMSPPESEHFFIVCLMNLMQGSTCPLLWWWYDDTACLTLRLLQKFLNFSEMKLPPASDINLCIMPYSANIFFTAAIRLPTTPPFFLLLGICYGSLQCMNNFCFKAGICLLLSLPMVSVVCHGVWSSPWAVVAVTQGTCYNCLHDFLYHY